MHDARLSTHEPDASAKNNSLHCWEHGSRANPTPFAWEPPWYPFSGTLLPGILVWNGLWLICHLRRFG